jgi:hypothetical protein
MIAVTSSVDFGPDKPALATVGYTLLDGDGVTVIAARSTAGVVTIGGGTYTAVVSFPNGATSGYVVWDAGDGSIDRPTHNVTLQLLAISEAEAPGVPDPIGPGAYTATLTFVLDGTTPLADADAWITRDPSGAQVIAGRLRTDTNGQVKFLLDKFDVDGDLITYYAWAQKDGVNSVIASPVICD